MRVETFISDFDYQTNGLNQNLELSVKATPADKVDPLRYVVNCGSGRTLNSLLVTVIASVGHRSDYQVAHHSLSFQEGQLPRTDYLVSPGNSVSSTQPLVLMGFS